MSVRRALLLVGVLVAAAVPPAGAAATGDDVPPAEPRLIESFPRERRVYMITDSVGLGARAAMPHAFGPEWQVTVEGRPALRPAVAVGEVAAAIRDRPWAFGDHVIIAVAYNYPITSVNPRIANSAEFDRNLDAMMAVLRGAGVKHVHWVTLREVKPQYISHGAWRQIQPYYWYFPEANDRLEAALERHPELSLIDWAAVADQPGLTYDAIHLNNTGAALYSHIAAHAVRAAETRVGNDSTTRIEIPDADGVEAVALNLTTTDPRRNGHLTAYACDGERPTTSNHNYSRAQVVAHSAIVPVNGDGEVCVHSHTATNLIVDVTGRFDSDAGITSSTPERLRDTRSNGSPQPAFTPLVVPAGPPGVPVALTVTALGATQPGWVRVAPCDSNDTTSNLNMYDAAPVPNVAVVASGADGTVCVTASVPTHLLVDRFVTFDDESGVAPISPRRVHDSRQLGGPVGAGEVVRLTRQQLGNTPATGVMLNLTSTGSTAPGYLAAYPCKRGRPDTSNLNFAPGTVVANFAIIEPDVDGDVCVYASAPTHVVIDLMGTTTAGFTGGAPVRLLDTRN